MTACAGCGRPLGFKKYRFHRMWRVPGYYCKECMLHLGDDFDKNARITLPKKTCDLCELEFYYLKSAWRDKKQGHYCDVCHDAVKKGVIPDKSLGEAPKQLPLVLVTFAGLGVLMMLMGLVFTLMATSAGESSLPNILFGAITTALGFVLFRKAMRSRGLLMARRHGNAGEKSA